MAFTIEAIAEGRFALRGTLDFASAEHAYAAGLGALERAASASCVFDCAALANADSAGLAVLLDWQRLAMGRGVTLSYEKIPDSIVRLARISAVEPLLASA